ncbi:MAG: glycerol-3-phosphate 1-O-acyltransferase PlsY [Oscillospiraceae bacterium]|nr:glycerol-3-phosphate 1-O-acyltransferase PlsY [Oscillospiraceae bacterium]
MEYVQVFWWPVLIVAAGSYLLGSINSAVILSRLMGRGDIRTMGSGNAGTTNMLRSVGKGAAVLTLFFDALKCVAAIVPTRIWFTYLCSANGFDSHIANYGIYIAGFFCMMGHIFPLYFKFKGGKGVVTLAATIALLDWRVFLICFAIFAIVFFTSRMMSLCSVIGCICYPIVTFCMIFFVDYRMGMVDTGISLGYVISMTVIAAVLGAVVILKHRSNIQRICNGTERKVSFHKEKTPDSASGQ